jgi:hypothetical protein
MLKVINQTKYIITGDFETVFIKECEVTAASVIDGYFVKLWCRERVTLKRATLTL